MHSTCLSCGKAFNDVHLNLLQLNRHQLPACCLRIRCAQVTCMLLPALFSQERLPGYRDRSPAAVSHLHRAHVQRMNLCSACAAQQQHLLA
jgi:hypothetical protein